MDIKQAIELKKALEVKICDLCGEFSDETGLNIKEIYFRCDTLKNYMEKIKQKQYRVHIDAGI